ncbi:MAG: alanine--tRNA ligase [Anaerolineales bacterium]
MTQPTFTGAQIRQTFIDFFVERGHTFVPSASLVPGGDATLLFTNAGMVQFKDVFLGTDKRPYTRAVNSQKCMRVAGKHNDLDDVGRDDWHHTFFEMLGNWSFGDYYKKEAIAWSWQLLTEVWGLPRERLYATCFKDDQGDIPTDEDAAAIWRQQPGMNPDHVLFFGRKENFWEMAETGPCGPCSEIHIDRGEEFCNLKGRPHRCEVNGDCERFLELWNNVFIQYNRLGPDSLEPLPATHVDTGMGFERIVAVLQGVDSNYKTDLFRGALDVLRSLTGVAEAQMYADFTPYRVIADHARAAAFLIADGVVPGNTGRNYVCRMIIRRAARFGTKIGLHDPFLARVAEAFIAEYGDFYPELVKHRQAIFDNLTREEIRFARTVESGTAFLQGLLDGLKQAGQTVLDGRQAFDLYATYGLPLEITRDIAREQFLEVDQAGFRAAMEEHRLASGGGKAMGPLGGEDAEFYAGVLRALQQAGQMGPEGVQHNPYEWLQVEGPVLALVVEGRQVESAGVGERVEVLLPRTGFYLESGGQVADEGFIRAADGSWEIEIDGVRKPAAGVIVHTGEVLLGRPRLGDAALALVDADRRHDIMRNHTATHLLHHALHEVLGEHARQAGSLVAPDRLRFDFTHPEALSPEQLERIERLVNEAVAADMPVVPQWKAREEAIAEGAMALFGEKYGETVRTLTIGDKYSYELCGGTHLDRTSDVGLFLIVSEGSAAAGIRRIEAVTGRGAYELVARRNRALKHAAARLSSTPEMVAVKVEALLDELAAARKQVAALRQQLALAVFSARLADVPRLKDVPFLALEIPAADADTLRLLADRFRQKYPSGVCVLASAPDDRPIVIAAVTEDLTRRGLHAGDLVKQAAAPLGGSGGGRPTLAQAGGKDPSRISEALAAATRWAEEKLK